uniref:Uncharacterized protein n=1 Tax=Rhizophora mucronata TaxID=61149 RepID=A0A2P2L049_RHIMU
MFKQLCIWFNSQKWEKMFALENREVIFRMKYIVRSKFLMRSVLHESGKLAILLLACF